MKKFSLFLLTLLVSPVFYSAEPYDAQKFEDAVTTNNFETAESLAASLPENSLERQLLHARILVAKNELQEAEKCYNRLLAMQGLTLNEKANLLAASGRLAEKRRDDKALLEICNMAEKELPADFKGRRMFLLWHAKILEKQNHWDKACEIYSGLLAGTDPEEQNKAQNEAKEIYFDILKSEKLTGASEVEARKGAARTMERSGNPELAGEILFNLATSERFEKDVRMEASVLYVQYLIRQNQLDKQEKMKWIEKVLADKDTTLAAKKQILQSMADDYYNRKEYSLARTRYYQLSCLPGINKNTQHQAIRKTAKCYNLLNRKGEYIGQLARLFWDRQADMKIRTEPIEEIMTYFVENKNKSEVKRLSDEFARMKDLKGEPLKRVNAAKQKAQALLAEEKK